MNGYFDKIDYCNRIYHQKAYVEELLASPDKFDAYRATGKDLRLIALYARDYLELKQAKRKEWIKNWLDENCCEYNEALWLYKVRRAMSVTKDGDQKLCEFEPPVIEQVEYEYIKSLGLENKYERLLMIILVIFKFGRSKTKYEGEGYYIPHWIFKPTDLENYYKVRNVWRETWYMYGELERQGLLGFSDAKGGQIIATFIGNIDYSKVKSNDKKIKVWNIESATMVYDWFEDEKSIGFCKHCGDLFKQNKTGRPKQFCKHCKPKNVQPKEEKLRACVDCHKIFERKLHDVESIRCEECVQKYRKEQSRLRMAKMREKNKELK